MKAIVAVCRLKNGKLGIGNNGKLPWKNKQDMEFFKESTKGKNLIMGHNTYKSIGNKPLKGRLTHYVLTRNSNMVSEYSNVIYCDYILLSDLLMKENTTDYYIIGGSEIYSLFKNYIDTIYLSIIPYKKEYSFDTYFEFPDNMEIDTYLIKDIEIIVYKKSNRINADFTYFDFAKNVLNGNQKKDRTGTGTISVFGTRIEFDLENYSFPLLTTKYVSFKLVCEELLWFLKGETDVTKLQEKNCNIWNYNTSREFLDLSGKPEYIPNILVEGYGTQIRNFNGFDQLEYIEDLIRNKPDSRRIMWNLWNSSKLNKMVLPPCHNQVQFYVNNGELSCHMYQRSIDTFLGFPWNIASYSLLTFILCKRNNLKPGKLIISGGDTHIYNNHIEQVKTQLKRTPRPSPTVEISDEVKKDWKELNSDMFKLVGYLPQSTIKGEMN